MSGATKGSERSRLLLGGEYSGSLEAPAQRYGRHAIRKGGLTLAIARLAARLGIPIPPRGNWTVLEAEFEAWRATGRVATLWWRDDDAVSWTPALQRLLSLADGTPIALAVVPGPADSELGRLLAGVETVSVLQHGWRHASHAITEEAESELGPERPLRQRLEELATGWDRLLSLFGSRSVPVLVPPWNRIGDDLIPLLPRVGFRGLSRVGPRRSALAAPGVRQVNIHADLVDWGRCCGFIGEEKALYTVWRHLRDRRLNRADPGEPTGILTHHLVMDDATERFVRRLILVAHAHGARFLSIPDLFPAL